jgi:glycosyltransferase involved in cell wall biosynthesis
VDVARQTAEEPSRQGRDRTEAVPGAGRRSRIVLFHRKPTPHVFSIEQVFELLRDRLPDRFEAVTAVSSFPSKGVVGRVRSMLEARGRQGDVNHVVGDVHYLSLLLDPSRTVLTVHDCEFMDRAGPLKRWIYKWIWLRLPVRRSRIVVTPSDAVRRELERYVPSAGFKVRTIPDPVAPSFSPVPRPFNSQEPVVLQVGTRPNKNLERVVLALRRIPCRLLILGPLAPEQRRLLTRCRIRYENPTDLSQEEVARCYRECDLVAFASVKEGFGLPIVEAQAVGRPVVAGDRPPLPQVAGGAACLVDPFDVGSIEAGIRRVIDDERYRERLVREGLRNVRRFDPDAIAERYGAVYSEILAALAPRPREAQRG